MTFTATNAAQLRNDILKLLSKQLGAPADMSPNELWRHLAPILMEPTTDSQALTTDGRVSVKITLDSKQKVIEVELPIGSDYDIKRITTP